MKIKVLRQHLKYFLAHTFLIVLFGVTIFSFRILNTWLHWFLACSIAFEKSSKIVLFLFHVLISPPLPPGFSKLWLYFLVLSLLLFWEVKFHKAVSWCKAALHSVFSGTNWIQIDLNPDRLPSESTRLTATYHDSQVYVRKHEVPYLS